MKTRETLKNIAKELGVSVSTVSKSLNNSPEISVLTKTKIQEYAKLKNYKPNFFGLNLKNRHTKTIGVIIPNILNSFFAKVFSGIEKVAEEKGYNVITCISNESIEKEISTLEILSNGTIDGFIVSVSEQSQKLKEYQHFVEIIKDGIPIVMFDRIADEINCDKVIVDDYDAAVNAVNHLLKTGCKSIALFSSIDNLSVGKLRAKGYFDALTSNNIAINEELVALSENQENLEFQALQILQNHKVDGVFCLDENSSVFAHKQGLKNGYQIPENLSIIGFADGLWSRRMSPSLSTISQHGPEIGEVAANLLIERLENKEDDFLFKTKIVKTELRLRESTINYL